KINVEISNAKAGRAIETPPEKIAEILDLKREGLTVREIAGELDMTKSTVHYLMKYAQRTKIKHGDTVLHIQ
ncbi:MAG: helix-turn-helix domain-containing protein, partial [Candidatus Diapherotrites archaeon]|nr:helix-turn-helix domain-containing protein [Candidatus Diapherotrites archaeon]